MAQAQTLPKIGDQLEGGKYRGILTDASGVPYILITVALSPARVGWDAQMAWAKGHNADLANPLEAALILQVAPEDFQGKWIWLNKPEGSDYAWYCHSNGRQGYNDRSAEGGGVAVRRLPLGSFDPLTSIQQRAAEDVARLRATAMAMVEACDAAVLA